MSSRTILISGASGELGKLVVSQLLKLGVKPSSIVALVRSADKGAQFEKQGVQVRIGDYGHPETITKALEGVTHALLISSNDLEHRKTQHETFVDAVKASSTAQFIAYTSLANIDAFPMLLAEEHKDTEVYIKKSGIPYSFLRNSWYLENNISQIHTWAQTGGILGATGQGVISAASRDDYAAAAAKVLTLDSPKKVYELGGNLGYTLDSLAKSASEVLGKPIQAVHLPQDAFGSKLKSFGLPEKLADVLADAEANAAKGGLQVKSGDLQNLIGRESESVETVMKRTLASPPASAH